MDETYIKGKGAWKSSIAPWTSKAKPSISWAAKRDAAAARRLFEKAMRHNEVPNTITIDKSGANKAALEQLSADRDIPIKVRQVKFLNNIVEQDHRAVKCVTRPMLGFKSFRAAQAVLARIELMHMIRKGQFNMAGCDGTPIADQSYTLAGQVCPQ